MVEKAGKNEQIPLCVDDLQELARARLDGMTWGYYASGARGMTTLADNLAAWDRYKLRPRMLRDVSRRCMSTTVLGQKVALPVLVAPMAFQRLAHDLGEIATVQAAGDAGSVMILSCMATTSMEDVCAAACGPVWFQLYVYKDRGITADLIARAKAAGCTALVITVDAPVLGTREADVRHGLRLPPGMSVSNVVGHGLGDLGGAVMESGLGNYVRDNLAADLTWRDIERFAAQSGLPVVVKGVLRGDDGKAAVDSGAAAVVVSNHGGRQLDGAVATADALADVVQAVNGAAEVYVDGGIRRGIDVVRALAMGANAVLMGRPVLWGLAWRGRAGAAEALAMIGAELDETMALCGCRDLSEITGDLLVG